MDNQPKLVPTHHAIKAVVSVIVGGPRQLSILIPSGYRVPRVS